MADFEGMAEIRAFYGGTWAFSVCSIALLRIYMCIHYAALNEYAFAFNGLSVTFGSTHRYRTHRP